MRVAFRTCPICEATCGLEITVRGDRVVRIAGDPEDVLSRGHLCPKGPALKELHEDPDRLERPLVRHGDGWKEASWEEALVRVERGLGPILESRGRDAVGIYWGNPIAHNLSAALYLRYVVKALGSKNVYSASTVDQMPKQTACGLLFGSATAVPVPDLDRTDLLMILGANPLVSGGSLCTAPDMAGRLKALRDRGGKLIVVDPVRTRTAKMANEHVAVRPAKDPYLLFGMVHTLFEESLVSPGRLAEHINGVDTLRDLARPYSPEVVAPACGVEADVIRRLAREVANAPKAAVYGRIGTCTVEFGTITSWLIDVINILTGNLDRAGGVLFPEAAHTRLKTGPGGKGFVTGRWRSRVRSFPEVNGELPIATLADEIETPGDGRVRGLITVAGNPVLTTVNSHRLDAALASLDFMVSVDFYLNETTRHAEVILPPPSILRQSHYDLFLYPFAVRNTANYSPPMFQLGPDEPDMWEILLKLALILGGKGAGADHRALDDDLLAQTVKAAVKDRRFNTGERNESEIHEMLGNRRGPERTLDLMLRTGPYGDAFGANPDGLSLKTLEDRPHGMDLGPLRPSVPQIIQTPSGKIELAPRPIIEDLTRLEASFPAAAEEGILLVGRRNLRSMNSWLHNLPGPAKGKHPCTLRIHPRDAGRLGLEDGGEAKVTSSVGSVRARVEITDDIRMGVVSLPHGWGHDLPGTRCAVARKHPGVNSNILTDDQRLDPLAVWALHT
ncbi:MAG: molybdopterin-dependent oxidoreductase [Deltaproteobacteria bacterium]|nr:molybdopterin-dependent oxidoreductase [Deltaproteobacteria bacterium]